MRGLASAKHLCSIHTWAHMQTHVLPKQSKWGREGERSYRTFYIPCMAQSGKYKCMHDQPTAYSGWVLDDDPGSGFCRKQVMTEVS